MNRNAKLLWIHLLIVHNRSFRNWPSCTSLHSHTSKVKHLRWFRSISFCTKQRGKWYQLIMGNTVFAIFPTVSWEDEASALPCNKWFRFREQRTVRNFTSSVPHFFSPASYRSWSQAKHKFKTLQRRCRHVSTYFQNLKDPNWLSFLLLVMGVEVVSAVSDNGSGFFLRCTTNGAPWNPEGQGKAPAVSYMQTAWFYLKS